MLDEPVSALDVSIQAGVVNLLEDLQDQLGLAYVFIAHDLSVVRHICDRRRRDVPRQARRDRRPPRTIYTAPPHPYTQALLSAVPEPDPTSSACGSGSCSRATCRARSTRRRVAGSAPAARRRRTSAPRRSRELVDRGQGHPVACHFAEVVEVLAIDVGGAAAVEVSTSRPDRADRSSHLTEP